jgi:hypothetical protein
MFWAKACVQHNGFFGTKISAGPSDAPSAPTPPRVDTWFRMIVKSIHATTKNVDFTQYAWYEMSFISTCGKDRNMLLCLDTPRSLAWNVLNVLTEEENKDVATGPYGLHQLLLEQLMVVYDESVWDIARIMRNNEKSKGVCITFRKVFYKLQLTLSRHSPWETQICTTLSNCTKIPDIRFTRSKQLKKQQKSSSVLLSNVISWLHDHLHTKSFSHREPIC